MPLNNEAYDLMQKIEGISITTFESGYRKLIELMIDYATKFGNRQKYSYFTPEPGEIYQILHQLQGRDLIDRNQFRESEESIRRLERELKIA